VDKASLSTACFLGALGSCGDDSLDVAEQKPMITAPMRWLMIFTAIAVLLLTGCDRQVLQTVIAQVNLPNHDPNSVWLVHSDQCSADRIRPERYRNGLWIFSLTSTQGGVGVVTQELSLCYQDSDASPTRAWHSVHGGGAPLIVLSCDTNVPKSCALYMQQHAEGAWEEIQKR